MPKNGLFREKIQKNSNEGHFLHFYVIFIFLNYLISVTNYFIHLDDKSRNRTLLVIKRLNYIEIFGKFLAISGVFCTNFCVKKNVKIRTDTKFTYFVVAINSEFFCRAQNLKNRDSFSKRLLTQFQNI